MFIQIEEAAYIAMPSRDHYPNRLRLLLESSMECHLYRQLPRNGRRWCGGGSRRRERESFQRGFYPKHGWIERDDTALFMYYLDKD